MTFDDNDRQPLPSEDTGDLVNEPAGGTTDDPLVASEEGVPYEPPTERVITAGSGDGSPAEVAGHSPTDAGELERTGGPDGSAVMPRDGELRSAVAEALRRSDLTAAEHVTVAVRGTQVVIGGEVESIDVVEEILAVAGDVPGVSDVVDETRITAG